MSKDMPLFFCTTTTHPFAQQLSRTLREGTKASRTPVHAERSEASRDSAFRCLAFARHDTVQGLWVNDYIIAIIYRDLSSRTYVRDLIIRDIFEMSRIRST